jgi:hypothetical protein
VSLVLAYLTIHVYFCNSSYFFILLALSHYFYYTCQLCVDFMAIYYCCKVPYTRTVFLVCTYSFLLPLAFMPNPQHFNVCVADPADFCLEDTDLLCRYGSGYGSCPILPNLQQEIIIKPQKSLLWSTN